MLKRDRHSYILHQLDVHNKVLCGNLCDEIAVSEDTIRRDLQELHETGQLIKVHGGAVSKSFYNYNHITQVYAQNSKQVIAKKTASLLKDGMFILTSGGTTIIELARCLPKELKATFITGSINVINEYMQHPNIDIIVLGDKLSKTSRITTGGEVVKTLRNMRVDYFLMGINSIDINAGVTDNDWEVVSLKQAMMHAAKQTVCITISEKMNKIQPLKVCNVSDLGMLVTELDPGSELLHEYREQGLEIL